MFDDDDDDDENGQDKGVKLADLVSKNLLEQRTILVAKPVSRELAAQVTAQLLVLERLDNSKPITVYVNSPGGDADSGFGIYDAMQFIDAPVTTVCLGLAASAAVVIFLGGERGKRFALPHSRFLIHQPSTYSQGTASDIEITANEIVKLRDLYNSIVARETGKTDKQVAKDVNRDFWLSADEAVEYGLVNKVVTSMKDIGVNGT